jgi:hypothetical protein
VEGVADGDGQVYDSGEGVEQSLADVAGEAVGAAQEHCQPLAVHGLVVGVACLELVRFQAIRAGFVGDVVCSAATHEGQFARR